MIRSLQYVALNVPDMDMGRRFYDTMGLEGRDEGDHVVYRCAGRAQDQIRLVPGEKKQIAWVTWGTRAGELATISANLENAGVPLAQAPAGFENNGLWVRDPDGILVNVIVAWVIPFILFFKLKDQSFVGVGLTLRSRSTFIDVLNEASIVVNVGFVNVTVTVHIDTLKFLDPHGGFNHLRSKVRV